MDPISVADSSRPKIVLVDDYEANLLALEIPLRDLNCEIIKFSSGKKALDFIRKNEVAVILLDIKMPIMDGYEVAQRVREMPHAKSTPIIFITGILPNEELIEKAYESGGSDYIIKPINQKVLASKVSIFIELFDSRNQLKLKALATSEEKFRTLSESMPQMVFTSDSNWVVTHFNQRWYQYTGLKSVNLDQEFWSQVIHPDELKTMYTTWEESKVSGQTWTHEYRIKRHDGVYRWHLARSVPKRNPEGQIIQWIGTVTDIEDQRQNQQRVEQSELRLSLALEAAKLGFWELDLATGMMVLSDRMLSDWGIPKKTFSGKMDELISKVHFYDRDRVMAEKSYAIKNHTDYDIEYRVVKAEKEVIWIRAQGRVKFDETGKATHFTGTSLDITERKNSEIELKNKEEELRTLSNSIPQLAWIAHANGDIFWYNDRWYDYTGTSLDEMKDWGWRTVHDPKILPQVEATYRESIQRAEAYSMEFPLRSKIGEYRWFLTRWVPLKDANGKVLRWFGTNTDIHDQKLATQDQEFRANLTAKINSLEKTEELISLATGSLGEYLKVPRCYFAEILGSRVTIHHDYAKDLQSVAGDYNFLDFGQEAFDSAQAGILLKLENVHTDERTKAHADSFQKVKVQSLVSMPLRRGNELVAAVGVGDSKPRNWSEREIEMIRVVAETIWAAIERTKLMSALKLSTIRSGFLSKASKVLNSSLEVEKVLSDLSDLAVPELADWCSIKMLDNEGELKQVAVSHKDPEKVKWAWELQKLFPPDKEALSGDYKVLRTGQPDFLADVTDEILEAASKNELQAEAIASIGFRSFVCVPILNRGTVVGTLNMVTTDESGRRYTEDDLNLAIELGIRAGLAVENARLYLESQAINRLKDEFLANLSHELRTPMNVILGYADILKTEKDSLTQEELNNSIEAIDRNAKAQTAIIADLLDVSSIITGKVSYKPLKLNAADTVSKILESLRPTAAAKGLKLNYDLTNAPVTVSVDSTRFHQIIWNLVSNAVKFTDFGGSVFVKLEQSDRHWSIAITDTGRGIDKDFLPYVFDRFRQEDASSTRRFGGLGLGLSVVRHLVELHGGYVKAESAGRGQGATFIVTLPLEPLQAHAPVLEKKSAKAEAEEKLLAQQELAHVKILLVEDSEDNRVLVNRILARAGADVVDADSARTAREQLKIFNPDVIISDIGMPDENGLEFIQKLRSTSSIPAIALTAYVRPEEKEATLKAGFQAHLGKPVSGPLLISTIRQFLP